MRYPPDHREKTRERILEAASVVFRRQGFEAGSVDDVMREAGLTAGGFYAHFESKEELFAQAFLRMLRESHTLHGRVVEPLQGPARVRAIAARYLSPAHRQMVDQGCPLPPLLADLPRQSAMRRSFEATVREFTEDLALHLSDPAVGSSEAQDRMLAILALLVGGVSLARGVADESLGNRILSACLKLVDSQLEPSLSTPKRKATRKKGQAPS